MSEKYFGKYLFSLNLEVFVSFVFFRNQTIFKRLYLWAKSAYRDVFFFNSLSEPVEKEYVTLSYIKLINF